MTELDINKLPLLNGFKYISLSSKIDNIESMLIGKWHLFKNEGNRTRDEQTNILIFDKNTMTTFEEKVLHGPLRLNYEEKHYNWFIRECEVETDAKYRDNINQFRKILVIKSLFKYNILYIDENIILDTYGTSDKISSILIKDEALSLFKSNDDIISYFSKFENQWENERLIVRKDISNLANGSYPALIWVFLIVTAIILSLIYDVNALIMYGGILCALIIGYLINRYVYKHIYKKTILKYRKMFPDNKMAKILTPILLDL